MTDDRNDFGDATSPTTDLFGSVPDHRNGFWEDLDRLLDDDQGGSSQPGETSPLDQPVDSASVVRPVDEDVPPDVVDLANHPRTRRRARPPVLAAAAAAAIVLVAVVARPWSTDDARLDVGGTSTTDGSDQQTGTVSTGAVVHLTYVDRQFGAAFTGDPVDDSYETTTTVEVFATEDGSYRVEYDTAPDAFSRDAFDAETQVSWGAYDDATDAGSFAQRNSGFLTPFSPYVLQRGTVGAVALASDVDASGSDEVDGRTIRRIETELKPNQISGGPDRITAIYDEVTGLPVEMNEFVGDRLVRTLELTDSDWDADVPADWFAVPADAETVDRGIVRTDDPAAIVGDRLPLPPEPLSGFELYAIEAADAPPGYVTGAEGSNPPASAVVVATYRAPWRSYRVGFIEYRDEGYGFGDPILGEGEARDESVVLLGGSGRFGGVDAELVFDPSTEPHVWGLDDGLAFLVAGDLSADALVQVAESIGS